ncbi:MAG: glycosyltransferase [Eubacterium sp.]|nr:glycosyltransferase [Eubacterium sp.]MCM1342932.1 glycosyltransferase [Muribaculaceae bacterium]MCM1411378.1 glycosyltransferase [Lachnospiraceae bacterium]
MRVLIITSSVVDYISVGKIATSLYKYIISRGNEAKLIYFGLNGEQTGYECINKNEFLTKVRYKLVLMSDFKMNHHFMGVGKWKRILKEYDPDIVQLIQPMQEFINIKALFKAIGEMEIPCVYTMIDESAYLGNCGNAYACKRFMEGDGCEGCAGENHEDNLVDYGGYWNQKGARIKARVKRLCYENAGRLCFVAPQWVIEQARKSVMLRDKRLYAVDEYVDNEKVYYPRERDDALLQRYGVERDKILFLNIARYSNERKGIRYYIELARRFENDERYQFVHIGYDGKGEGLPANYIAIPFVEDQNITSQFYTAADLFIITSMADTMPNVCLEALSCGTPVCGFDISGIPYVADEPIGRFVEAANVGELEKIVRTTQKKTDELSRQCREYALSRYSPKVYGEKMLSIYEEMLE